MYLGGNHSVRFKGLDLNLLIALDVLIAEQSVTKAAGRLNLSQSAVSCALNRLRDHLQDELLVKVGRNMVLTPFATALGNDVRNLLLQIDATMKSRPEFIPGKVERTFKIAASDYMAHVAINRLRRRVFKQAPGIKLELLQIGIHSMEMLDQGTIDLVIAPSQFLRPGQSSQPLLQDTIVCLVSENNQLVGDEIDLPLYMSLEHVAFQPEGLPATFERWMLANLGKRNIRVSTLNYAMLPYFILDSDMVATLPLQLALLYSRILPVRIVQPRFHLLEFTETMQWHKASDRDPGISWLRNEMAEAVAEAKLNHEM
jgi:DNA-binding transcriptional LysR family regulator